MRGFVPYLLAALICLNAGSATAAPTERLMIIGNANVPVQAIDTAELTRIFMLKRTVWPDGTAIVPVNREARSEERQYFSKQVLGRSMRSLASYWNHMQFKGFMPPVVQESDAAVAAFVRNVPGAVGYIVADKVPEGVRVLGEIK
ncbi:substrate-binding domain-containing protein [Kordiimonas marina]|uniref:substrate-binding domain-containing protein n=1 Tax=Kordiimonas marina TaxID=2872312 RepID=UPI001FF624DA|nr:hypothetical protein [Kordiimonas marina]MCJ9429620.1 hypothetical protein [Kordiimonas marina]